MLKSDPAYVYIFIIIYIGKTGFKYFEALIYIIILHLKRFHTRVSTKKSIFLLL